MRKVATFQLFLYHKIMKSILVLLAEVSGLLIVFALFLFILNYFNVIKLPNPFYKATKPAANTQNFTPASFKTQAVDAQIQKYKSYAVRFSKPQAQTNPDDFVSDAVFAGYAGQTIQVVTKEGVLNLNFDQTTIFQKLPDNSGRPVTSSSSGTALIMIKYATAQDFFKNVTLGSVIQVLYSKSNLKATQVNYIEASHPVL